MPTMPIDRVLAAKMHLHFANTYNVTSEDTKAVLFRYSELDKILTNLKIKLNLDSLPGDGFYCYFAKYLASDGARPNKNTIIVAFARITNVGLDKWEIIDNKIYDFGEPCPQKCPENPLNIMDVIN